ncbi:leucine--tRNA ligase [Candidatus Saccharibacteria bacterium]|nr:leucine--tRNA ligase [Candidatus Saccharibacteria bacterium]
MSRYEPLKIEAKWQERWETEQSFVAVEKAGVPKMYIAEMFPYPSGAGLHVGHVRNFSIVDCLARFYRQNGLNVLRPFGYDTFGLPAENYAIKTGVSPQEATETNIASFRKQLKRLGYAIDWSREFSTSDPEYYRWTQWCFLQLYKKGLAYQAENYQWWCPVDQTVLANEQVEGGRCWRCGSEVEKKKMKQWFFKITEYADELLDEIDALDWPEKIKTMQKNWIGRSEGAEIDFAVDGSKEKIKVFTTRPDTLFGATFLVLAPEHPAVEGLANDDTKQKVDQYRTEAMKKSDIERQENKEKTGVFTGAHAINPATGEKMQIWVADYVLMGYGTGAIMAVPAHDGRDFEFATKFELPIRKVVEKPETLVDDEICYTGEGELVNSGNFDGEQSSEAREQIVAWLEQQEVGKKKVIYRMRDWLISRQRYWGAPIPIAYDKDGKAHAVPEDQLPVILPKIDDYTPDNSGRSALAKHPEWMEVEIDGKKMTRETDTMDGYACSSWYLWRYCDAHNNKKAWSPEKVNYWAPTDVYVGGDHAVAHLLYVRFWCKFFADQGLLDFREPVKKLLYNGYINAPDGKKMSKSKGNVIDPLDIIDQGYGADTLRTYELFIGPYDLDAAWDTKAIGGVYRFLNRCYNLTFGEGENSKGEAQVKAPLTEVARHRTIKKVTEDLHRNSFNTAVAALMEFVNELYKNPHTSEDLTVLARLLKPFAPHLASEMLEKLGADDVWPEWDEKYLVSDTVEIVVQVNGKLRARVMVAKEAADDAAQLEEAVRADEKVKAQLEVKQVIKVIALPKKRLVSFVIK